MLLYKLFHSTSCILLFFLALFLKPPTSVSWDDNSPPDCPYPCLPTSVTNCPPPPPAASYPPPPPSTPGYWNYPPPPSGYYPYFPPPYANFPAAPPPPNPILPWFPWYYKSPPPASMAPSPDKAVLRKLVMISLLVVTMCFII